MKQNTLYAGYSKQNITPDYSCPLSGYGNELERMSEAVLDDLFLTCVAITSGEETILIYSGDIIGFNVEMMEQMRAAIKEATGIAGEKVFFTATHTHSGPAPYLDHEYSYRIRETLAQAAAAGAKEALADREAAEILTTTEHIRGMNFIRHYLVADGTFTGSNFGNPAPGLIGHASATDPRMILVQLKRESKPAIVLTNWQAHNDSVREVGFLNLSASYVGKFREKFEEKTGMLFVYVCGASGNQNRGSKIKEENPGLSWIDYGHKMAEYAVDALKNLKKVEGTEIKTIRVDLEVNANHAWDYLLDKAEEVCDLWYKTSDRYQATELAKTYGMTSCYHASTIIARAKQPATTTLELNAFSIGELGFVTSTNEVFAEVGHYVRAYAPYSTVVFCAANRVYLPSAIAYDYRSYEADTTSYAKGTCEKVSRELVRMLEELKKA